MIDRLLEISGHLTPSTSFVMDHEALEPWLLWSHLRTTWVPALKHRTLLVVSLFNNSVARQVCAQHRLTSPHLTFSPSDAVYFPFRRRWAVRSSLVLTQVLSCYQLRCESKSRARL